jgi:outer membrane protein OmpA-like peptidoglycan-associated protein
LEARGTPIGTPPPRPLISAVYDTNYGPLYLVQSGSSVSGCYYAGDGKVTGSTDGRIINFEWREKKGTSTGSALMVLTSKGDFLNGVYYRNGVIQGTWFGTRGRKTADCSPNDSLENDLQATGKAILYGIRFASDSARVTADSSTTLGAVLALMNKQPSLKLRIEGHTDSTNTDQYNLQLSKRRAAVVVDWLVQHGIAASRLSADGFGSSRPVADNVTAQGRMLNRRVEISLLK